MRDNILRYNYISIEGNIGAGKTTLAKMIAEDFNGRLILEQFEENSFLPKFYKDPGKYSLPLELTFLAERYYQLKNDLAKQDLFSNFNISDYYFYKCYVFARHNLDRDMFRLFSNFFSILNANLPSPDLILYLYSNTDRLLDNIKKRGRSYEQDILPGYLNSIQNGYLEMFRATKDLRIIILDIQDMDFVKNRGDYMTIINILKKQYSPGLYKFPKNLLH